MIQDLQSRTLRVVFFGSFQSYSVQVLDKLLGQPDVFQVIAVVTTPPRPAGREMILKPTEVQGFAEKHKLPVLPLEALDQSPEELKLLKKKPDFIVVAGYGKLVPPHWLDFPKIAPINIHFSLLPHYPGRFPAEWAILMGEDKTGVTLITMSPEFDKGEIIAQEVIPITPTDTRETLYKQLYDLGGEMTVKTLPEYASGKIHPSPQDRSQPRFYARQITREDGFVPWEILKPVLQDKTLQKQNYPPLFREIAEYKKIPKLDTPAVIKRMVRAFDPWPGVWTHTPSGKRLKILKTHPEPAPSTHPHTASRLVIDSLQVEGRSPLSGHDAKDFLNRLVLKKI